MDSLFFIPFLESSSISVSIAIQWSIFVPPEVKLHGNCIASPSHFLISSGRSREWTRGGTPSLFLDQTEARRAKKNFFGVGDGPPFWMTGPPVYLKVWIRQWCPYFRLFELPITRTPDKHTFFDFPRRFELSGVDSINYSSRLGWKIANNLEPGLNNNASQVIFNMRKKNDTRDPAGSRIQASKISRKRITQLKNPLTKFSNGSCLTCAQLTKIVWHNPRYTTEPIRKSVKTSQVKRRSLQLSDSTALREHRACCQEKWGNH